MAKEYKKKVYPVDASNSRENAKEYLRNFREKRQQDPNYVAPMRTEKTYRASQANAYRQAVGQMGAAASNPVNRDNALYNLARQTVDDRARQQRPAFQNQAAQVQELRDAMNRNNYDYIRRLKQQQAELQARRTKQAQNRTENRKDSFVQVPKIEEPFGKKSTEVDPRTEYRQRPSQPRHQYTQEEGQKLIAEYRKTHPEGESTQSIGGTNAVEVMQLRQNAMQYLADQEEERRKQEGRIRRQSGREGNITAETIRDINPEDVGKKTVLDRARDYLRYDPSGSATANFGDVLYPSLRSTGNPMNEDLDKKFGIDRMSSQNLTKFAAAGSLAENNPLMAAEQASKGSPIQADRARSYTMMTPEEKRNYNAILALNGLSKAEEYHDALLDDINARIARDIYEGGTKEAGTASKALYTLASGLGQGIRGIGEVGNAALGTSNTKATPVSQNLAAEIRRDENNSKVQNVVYDLAQSTGNMLPGIAASAFLGPQAGSAVFAFSQAGNSYREAINAGESTSTATMYSLQQGIDEMTTNFLLGGIQAFGGGAIKRVIQDIGGDAFTKALDRVCRTPAGKQILNRVIDYMSDMGSEAAQEYVQFYTENWTQALLGMKDQEGNPVVANLNPLDPNALYSALLGALNAGALNVPQIAGRTAMASRMDVSDAQQVADFINKDLDISAFNEEDLDKAIRLADISQDIQAKQEQGIKPSLIDKAAYASATEDLLSSDSVRETRENNWKEMEKQDIENLSGAFFGENGKQAFESEIAPENRLGAYRTFVAYYNHGYSGAQIPTEIERNAHDVMSTDQISAALRAGALDHQANFPNAELKTVEDSVSNIKIEGTKEGRIDKSRLNENLLTSQQRFRVRYASALISKTLGIDVEFFQSVVGMDGKFYDPDKVKKGVWKEAKNGAFYVSAEGRPTIRLDVNAGMLRKSDWTGELGDIKTMLPIISHELTHYLEKFAPQMYEELSNMVINNLIANKSYGAGLDFNTIVERQRRKMEEDEGREITNDYVLREMVARACEDMLSGNEDAVKAFEKMNNKTKRYIWNHIKKVFKNIEEFFRQMLGTYRSGSAEAQIIRQNMEEFEKIRAKWQEALGFATSEGRNVQFTSPINAETETGSVKDFVNGVSKDGVTLSGEIRAQASERTYEHGGRDFLKMWLETQSGLSKEDKEDVVEQIDRVYNLMQDIKKDGGLDGYTAWSNVENRNGQLTVVVPNGEYPLNIDFSTVCKKRKALDHILNVMIQQEHLSAADLAGKDIVRLQNIIKSEGLEIACALCFVDSKRYRIGDWADRITAGRDTGDGHQYGFNELLDSLIPDGSKLKIDEHNFTGRNIDQPKGKLLKNAADEQLDFELVDRLIKNSSKSSWNYKVAKAIREHPEIRSYLNSAELLSSIGFDPIRVQSPALYDLINNAGGSSKPKLSFSEVPYLNDILMNQQMKPEQAYKVGGVRIQSFSDFMANMVFDYVQMVGELQAKQLPAHAYTKESSFVALFGMTGIKINMSLVPKATTMSRQELNNYLKQFKTSKEKSKAFKQLQKRAGLDENGNYIWEDETFPYEVAMHFQSDPKYAKNCGTIAVGISDAHIRKLLADPTIQMVIPYHKSGINQTVAKLRGIDLYIDYTNQQNTRYKSTKKKISNKDNTFDFYAVLKETGDPKATADAYLKWCDDNNFIPKFAKFAKGPGSENYYKLLADFRLYDENGNYAPQEAVKAVYPEDSLMKKYIVEGYTYTTEDGKVFHNGGLRAAESTSELLDERTERIIQRYNAGETGNEAKVEKMQYSSRDTEREEKEKKIITRGMSHEERYNILKEKNVRMGAVNEAIKKRIPAEVNDELQKGPSLGEKKSQTLRKLFRRLSEEFGVKKDYYNKDINLEFHYSGNNVGESISKQKTRYEDLALLFTCMDDVVDGAVGIEVHNRNDEGYKTSKDLQNVYVLAGAFEDGDRIVPVKLEVKEIEGVPNTLHVAIALNSIKKSDIYTSLDVNDDVAPNPPSLFSNISVPQLLTRINSEDEDFVKYIPRPFRTMDRKTEQYSSREDDAFSLWQDVVSEKNDAAGRDSVFFLDEDDPTKVTYQQQEYFEEMSKTNDTIKAMNAALHQAIGEGKKVDVDKFAEEQAKKLRRSYGSKTAKGDLTEAIRSLCEKMNAAIQKDANDIAVVASNIGREVMQGIVVEDDTMRKQYPNLKRELKTYRILPGEKVRADMAAAYDSYEAFRRRAFGNLTIVGDDAGNFVRVDSVYQELNEKYPELFPDDIQNESEQMLRIMEVAQEVSGKKVTYTEAWGTSQDNLDEMSYMIGQDILNDYYKAAGTPAFGGVLESVRNDLIKQHKADMKEAFAEKNRTIRDLRERLRNAEGKDSEKIKARLEALRNDKNNQLARMQQRYEQKMEKIRERRIDADARTRLLKAAQRLARMKGGPDFEARKEALVGDLDLFAKGIGKNTKEKLEQLKTEADQLAAQDENYRLIGYEKARRAFERLSKKRIADMTGPEVAELTERIVELTYMQQATKRILDKELQIQVATAGKRVIAQQKLAKGINDRNVIGSTFGRYALNMLNPTRAMARLDGYQRDGVLTKLGKALNDGQTRQNEFTMRASKKFNTFLDAHPDLVRTWYQTDIDTGFKGEDGKPIYINKGMRISLYLHSLNYQNRNHIARAGIEVPDAELYRKGKYAEAYRYQQRLKLQPTDIKKITDGMTADEKAFANLAKEYLNVDTKDAINETSMVLNGTYKATVDNYFPIRTDPNFVMGDITGLIQDGTIEGWGALKERKEGAAKPVLLEDVAVVLQRQTTNTAKYYGLAIPVRDFNKVIKWQETTGGTSVGEAINKTWGKTGTDYIRNVLRDIQTGAPGAEGPGAKLFSSLKSTYAGTVLNWNIGVSIKQSASAPFAAVVLDTKSIAKAFAPNNFFRPADLEYMDSITPWSYMRRQGMSGTEMGEVYKPKNFVQKSEKLQKFKQKTNFIQAVDVWTTNRLFLATEYYVQDHFPDLEKRGPEYNRKVAELYNDMLQRTQPSYDVMQRNAFLRSDSPATKIFGMFKTQTFNMGGEVIDAWGRLTAFEKMHKDKQVSDAQLKKVRGQFGRTVGATIASQLMLTALGVLAKAVYHNMKNYRDDKGEVTPESTFMRAIYEFLTSFSGMTMGGSEAQSFFLALTGKEKWYDMEYPGLSTINDFMTNSTKVTENFRKACENGWKADDAEKFRNSCAELAMSAAILGRIPADNIYKLANALYLHVQDIKNGDFGKFEAGESLLGLRDSSVTKDQYAQRAAAAYAAGDTAAGDQWAEKTTNKKLQAAMYGDLGIDEDSSKAMVAYVKDGGNATEFERGQALAKELEEKDIKGDEVYAYVVGTKDYTNQEKIAWFKSSTQRTDSKKYTAWKDAVYGDWDFLKYRSDLSRFSGDGKQDKIVNYIKTQTTDTKKRKALWMLAGYKESSYDKNMN